MYLLYCDETNLDAKQVDFFVYGGIAIPSDRAKQLWDAIAARRRKAGIPWDTMLKFKPAPDKLCHNDFNDLKQSVIELAASHQCKFFVVITLHRIAASADKARLFAINSISRHSDCFLSQHNTHGLVLIDRFDDKHIDKHLKEKANKGLTGSLPFSEMLPLEPPGDRCRLAVVSTEQID